MTQSWWEKVNFGRTGLSVSRLAIGSSYGIGGSDLERARERGINFFFWGLRRTDRFAEGLRSVVAGSGRDGACIAIQSYSRSAVLMKRSVERALGELGIDYVDLLCLGWWSDVPPKRIVDAALGLQASGKVRHIMISCHHRPSFPLLIADQRFEAIMVRYNAAHPGAEREVFPYLDSAKARPGVLGFTATRWGTLLKPELSPGEKTPNATDCYRFVLSNPNVNVSLAGPKNAAELESALAALDLGPLPADELAWLRRVGESVHARAVSRSPITFVDKITGFLKRPAPLPQARANDGR